MYFDFVLPRNTKQKALNMVLNSNDRFHNKEKGKITRRIRNFAYWHTSINKDKKRAAFSPSNPCEVVVTVCSPTKSKLDPPNLYPTVKAITFKYGGLSNEKGHYKLIFEIEGVEK